MIFSGCATNGQIDKQARGSGLGALTGAVLAYGLSRGHSDKEIAIVVGTLLGAAAGDAIGRKLTIDLLEFLDSINVTHRNGNARVVANAKVIQQRFGD